MKTKPITLILTLLFCLSGSVVAKERFDHKIKFDKLLNLNRIQIASVGEILCVLSFLACLAAVAYTGNVKDKEKFEMADQMRKEIETLTKEKNENLRHVEAAKEKIKKEELSRKHRENKEMLENLNNNK